MKRYRLTLKGPTFHDAARIRSALHQYESDELTVRAVGDDSGLRSESDLVTLIADFISSGGLQAVAAVSNMVSAILRIAFPDAPKEIEITINGKTGTIRSDMTEQEVQSVINDLQDDNRD